MKNLTKTIGLLVVLILSGLDAFAHDTLKRQFPLVVKISSGGGFQTLSSNHEEVDRVQFGSLGLGISVESVMRPGLNMGVSFFRNRFLATKASHKSGFNSGGGLFLIRTFQSNKQGSFYGQFGLGYSALAFDNYETEAGKNKRAETGGFYATLGIGYRKIYDNGLGVFVQFDNTALRYFSASPPWSQPKPATWQLHGQWMDLRLGMMFGF
ncbi:MAG TPA: hypothetical protein PK509_11275 [Catalimonadaceae bacterium]|nr:hypothetical protein [Catalimonadaceae bacterium]